MTQRTLEELAVWAKSVHSSVPNSSNARGFVACVRKQKDPRECWEWVQGLLREKDAVITQIAELLSNETAFSEYSLNSVRGALYLIRKSFLGLEINRSVSSKAAAVTKQNKGQKPVKLTFGEAPKPAPAPTPATVPTPVPDGLRERLKKATELGLSPEVFMAVITDIVK